MDVSNGTRWHAIPISSESLVPIGFLDGGTQWNAIFFRSIRMTKYSKKKRGSEWGGTKVPREKESAAI